MPKNLCAHLVEGLEVWDGRGDGEVVGEAVLQVGDQHAELGAPVPQVVDPQHVMPHPLQQTADTLTDYRRPVVAWQTQDLSVV